MTQRRAEMCFYCFCFSSCSVAMTWDTISNSSALRVCNVALIEAGKGHRSA